MKIKPTNLSDGLGLGDEEEEASGMSLRMILAFIELGTCLKGGSAVFQVFVVVVFFCFLFYV